MRQFVFGAIFGASAVALGLLQWPVGLPPSSPSVASPDTPKPSSPEVRVDPTASIATRDVRLPSEVAAAASRAAEAVQTTGQAASTAPAMAPTRTAVMDAPAPIRLSAEHAKALFPASQEGRRLTIQEQHMLLTNESKDASWALEMEQNINQFLAQNNASGEFEILTVECRKTLCEILAFGNLPNSHQRWNAISAEMTRQAWGSNFQGSSSSTGDQNGRATIITILERAKR
jgi:hypothetical protein